MLKKVKDITSDVRIAIDQNSSGSSLIDIGDIDTLSLDEIIKSKIVDAAKTVEKSAPVYMLGTGKPFGDSIEWFEGKGVGKGAGRIYLPDDFMRLISFQMSDWSRAVYEAIMPDSPKYQLQSSRFDGIRGNTQKPVCAIVPSPTGLNMEFYSCKGGDSVNIIKAQYLPEPAISETDDIDIPEKCYRAIVYYCAGLVCSAYQSTEQGEQMFKISNDLLE